MVSRKKIIIAFLLVLAGIAWWEHKSFLARLYVHQLIGAPEADRDDCVGRIVRCDDAATPALLSCVEDADKRSCDNLEYALVALAGSWGPADARSQALLERIADRFSSLPACAQDCVLQVPIALLKKKPGQEVPRQVLRIAGELLSAAARNDAPGAAVYHLAGSLVEQLPEKQWLDLGRRLTSQGIQSPSAAIKVAAVQLLLRAPLRHDHTLLANIVPLLADKDAGVRKTALVALGPARSLISDDDLLPLLHDPDEDVQSLCELALRSRGLEEDHILLARLISDDRPSARLQVVQRLGEATDLDPGVWLFRLCQDPSPAVRAAAVRAAGMQSQADLRNCLHEMAQDDPSPTVRQLAAYYVEIQP